MDDKTELLLLTTLGIGPGLGLLAARLLGWHNFLILIAAMILGAAVGFAVLIFFPREDSFDEHEMLKTKHRKLIVYSLRCAAVIILTFTCNYLPH